MSFLSRLAGRGTPPMLTAVPDHVGDPARPIDPDDRVRRVAILADALEHDLDRIPGRTA